MGTPSQLRRNNEADAEDDDDDSLLLLEHVSDLNPENKRGRADFREASRNSLGRVTSLLLLVGPGGGAMEFCATQ